MNEVYYMRKALSLAEKGRGYTGPNPLVGAVLVKNGKIIGRGYHERFGGNHAEVNAIISARGSVKDSTLFVNLEPCSHFGRTPPCTDKIIESRIKKVIISHIDPNPIVNGRGLEKLKKAGINVETGILDREAKRLNEIYLKFISHKKPFVILKAGMSLDGKIATKSGDSKWITGKESRDYVYSLRSRTDAVLVGIKTVLIDDPYLTSHGGGTKKNPKKIVLDTHGRLPLNSNIMKNPEDLILVVANCAPEKKIKKIKKTGAEVLIVNKIKNVAGINELLKILGEKDISSVLVEGGSEVNGSFFDYRLVDKVLFFISPMIIGGREAYSLVGGEGIKALRNAVKLKDVSVKNIGRDYLFEGYPEWR
ncbi:MAG: bifunctional diaminohydroxyphosphoribosylaminopyrimidine deaminase/5-amino-6-(5-phosphoribosylamino)uracil reductase RibD [bacterium]